MKSNFEENDIVLEMKNMCKCSLEAFQYPSDVEHDPCQETAPLYLKDLEKRTPNSKIWLKTFVFFSPMFWDLCLQNKLWRENILNNSYLDFDDYLLKLYIEYLCWIKEEKKDIESFYTSRYPNVSFSSYVEINPFISFWACTLPFSECIHIDKNIIYLPELSWLKNFRENLKQNKL